MVPRTQQNAAGLGTPPRQTSAIKVCCRGNARRTRPTESPSGYPGVSPN